MAHQFSGSADSKQVTEQAGVNEIQFGAFDYPLVEILIIRLQSHNDKTGFQYGQPAFDRNHGNSAISGKRGIIQNLSGASGAKPEKTLKSLKIADVNQVSHIPFKIGLRVLPQPVKGGIAPVMHWRIKTALHDLVKFETVRFLLRFLLAECKYVHRGIAGKFAQRKRQQMKYCTTSRQ